MSNLPSKAAILCALLLVSSPTVQAIEDGNCPAHREPNISFVAFPSVDLLQQTTITVKGKLKIPASCNEQHQGKAPLRIYPAVVILHGSAGVDSRGDFYARALNDAGIATLEIDYWEARGVTGQGDRPPVPILTYPDAFAALAFLSAQESIDPHHIGVLGFSWGGVMSLASAEQLYANQFGHGLKFAAHVAHYPSCYGANNPTLFPSPLTPATAGTQWLKLTGAPVLIEIGTEDDYDNGAEHCISLVDDLIDPQDRARVEVEVYEGAFHAWDRLQVPVTALDPFADEGSYLSTGIVPTVEIVPNVDHAYESRRRVVNFFTHNL